MTITRGTGLGSIGFPPPSRLQYNRCQDQEQMTKERKPRSPFRQVEASGAGPEALGLLLPPGRRTLVLLRPRSLDWDLVPVRPDETAGPQTLFWEVDRNEGAKLVS